MAPMSTHACPHPARCLETEPSSTGATTAVTGARPLDVACDESGADGENLTSGNTDVFAHASVHLTMESAEGHIQEIRDRIRSPAEEYKANHLLRQKHRAVLEWLLGPSGPLHGHAHVHLTDKVFFVVGRVVDLLAGAEDAHPATGTPGRDGRTMAMAVTLYREGRPAFGRDRWQTFLESANNLMRTKNRWEVTAPVDSFFDPIEALRPTDPGGGVGDILELFRQARPRADSFRERILDNQEAGPALDPFLPAVTHTIAHWGAAGRPVSIVHDEQYLLTEERISWLMDAFNSPCPSREPAVPRSRLTGVRLVDSRWDARVQLADFLAGVARKIASDELNGRGDAVLTRLLRPYVDPFSIWGDDRSWSLLGPG
jgi:hypothetical protein